MKHLFLTVLTAATPLWLASCDAKGPDSNQHTESLQGIVTNSESIDAPTLQAAILWPTGGGGMSANGVFYSATAVDLGGGGGPSRAVHDRSFEPSIRQCPFGGLGQWPPCGDG